MLAEFDQQLANTLAEIRSQGLYKTERSIASPQEAHIGIAGGRQVLNMCANNYLGLADHPALIAAAKEALDTHGFGMASVRFICGTQTSTKISKTRSAAFSGQRTRFFIRRRSMPTAVCSKRSSVRRTP